MVGQLKLHFKYPFLEKPQKKIVARALERGENVATEQKDRFIQARKKIISYLFNNFQINENNEYFFFFFLGCTYNMEFL